MALKSKYFYNLQASVTKSKRLVSSAVDLISSWWMCLREAAKSFQLSEVPERERVMSFKLRCYASPCLCSATFQVQAYFQEEAVNYKPS